MAETSGPFDVDPVGTPGGYEGMYQAEWSRMARVWSEDGVIGEPLGASLQVFISGAEVGVRVGEAEMRGHWYGNTTPKMWTPTPNAAGQPRTDRVVLRLDRPAKKITAEVIEGSAGSPPPALTQVDDPDGVWEMPLGGYQVPANDTLPAGVFDQRTYQGLRLWRPSSGAMLPVSGVARWQKAVLPSGNEVQWTGEVWRTLYADAEFTGSVYVQGQAGSITTATSAGRFQVLRRTVEGNVSFTSNAIYGAPGVARFYLPVMPSQIPGASVGSFTYDSPSQGISQSGPLLLSADNYQQPVGRRDDDTGLPFAPLVKVGDNFTYSFRYFID